MKYIFILLACIITSIAFASSKKNSLDNSMTIINRLKNVTVEQVADALDALGIKDHVINNSVSLIIPIDEKQIICGKAYTVQFTSINDSRPAIGKHTRSYLDNVPPESVIIISNIAGNDFSVWGGLLSHYAIRHGILGIITNGSVRDVNLIKQNDHFSVFSTGETSNRGDYKKYVSQKEIEFDNELKKQASTTN